MATIRGVIQIQDQMSPALRAMDNALNLCINSFENMQSVSGNAVDTSVFAAARTEIQNASASITQMEENINAASANQQNFNETMRQGQSTADGLLGKIKGFVGAYVGIQGAKMLVGASDEMAQTQARLNLLTGDLGKTKELQDQIYQSAQRARASYTDTANAVAQLGNRAKAAFNNTNEVVAFTEQLNKMFTIAGASQEEMSSATLQLTQALGSGVLRGEEFNAVFEAAPNIMQAVADYMGEPIGKLKDMASEGMITSDIVKKAMFAAADETNEKFNSMPMTWSQVWTEISNFVLMASQPILSAINWIANNIDVIGPIVIGIAGAIGVYLIATYGATAATWLWTQAQAAFNAVMAMNPIALTAMAIILVIAAVYAVVAAFNKWKGTSISATGIIAGAVMGLYAIVYNAVAGIWNIIASLAEFVANVFTNPVYSVQALFINMAISAIDSLSSVTSGADAFATSFANSIIDGVNSAIEGLDWFIEAVNKLPGLSLPTIGKMNHTASITSSFKNTSSNLKGYLENNKPSNYIEIPKMQMKDIAATAMAGYNWGADKEASVKDMFSNTDNTNYQDLLDAAKGANQGAGDTAKNTGAIKDNLDITEEDLKYLRDIAEQEVINRFTTAEIKVDMINHNTINNDMDIDGICNALNEKVEEAMNTSAEGVHE